MFLRHHRFFAIEEKKRVKGKQYKWNDLEIAEAASIPVSIVMTNMKLP